MATPKGTPSHIEPGAKPLAELLAELLAEPLAELAAKRGMTEGEQAISVTSVDGGEPENFEPPSRWEIRRLLMRETTQCPLCNAQLTRKFLRYRHHCETRKRSVDDMRAQAEESSIAGFKRRISNAICW